MFQQCDPTKLLVCTFFPDFGDSCECQLGKFNSIKLNLTLLKKFEKFQDYFWDFFTQMCRKNVKFI
jgi:hypothetical protein